MNARPGMGVDPSRWWDDNDTGMGGRPGPGTRVLLPDGRRGTVQPYEGCWTSPTFPVRIDLTGQTLMLAVHDVTVLISGMDRAGGADTEAAG